MPVVSLLAGASVRLFGMGLFQARLVPLALASVVLLLTYLVGRRLFSAHAGLVAATALAVFPPFLDLSRVVRYDIGVPVFGLAAWLALEKRPFVAGLFAGLAALCHVYGAAWLVVLALLKPRDAVRVAAGFGAALLPWAVYIATGWNDFVLQNWNARDRIQLTSPGFYASNVWNEIHRYAPLRKAALLAPWIWVGGAAAGVAILLRERRRELVVPLVTLAGLFALLLSPKTFGYLATVWPLAALALAVALVRLPNGLLAASLLALAADGLVLSRRPREATSAKELATLMASHLPRGSRVLALQDYWLDLARAFPDYRSLHAAIDLATPSYSPSPPALAAAMDAYPFDVLLLDQKMLDFLAQSPPHPMAIELRAYLVPFRRVDAFRDPTYGRFEVLAR